jgi:hypothetical protein
MACAAGVGSHRERTRGAGSHALVMGITETDGKTASFHLGFEIEDTECLHAIR